MEYNILKKQGRLLKGINTMKNLPLLKIWSYNILAESNIFNKKHFNNKIIEFPQRLKIIKDEIDSLNPDIVCVQELDELDLNNFDDAFNDIYKISLEKKINKSEGLGILYKKNRFKEIYDNKINFDISNFLNLPNYKNQYISKLLNYSNITYFKVLYDNISQKNILILNNHLPFNKNRGFVKFYEIYINFLWIEKIKKKYYIDITLMCGDFNFIPNSAVYDYIINNKFDINTHQWEYSNQTYLLKLYENNSLNNIKKLGKISNKKYKRSLYRDYKFDFNFDAKDFFEFITHLSINDSMEISFDINLNNDIIKLSEKMNFKNSYEVLFKKLNIMNEYFELISHSNGQIKIYCDFIL